MPDFSHSLGDTVKRARKQLGLTQQRAAEVSDIDQRTILNIENYRGNPKLEVLFRLVRALHIDAQEIFYPEMEQAPLALSQLRCLVEDCTEQEAAALLPVIEAVLSAIRSRDTVGVG